MNHVKRSMLVCMLAIVLTTLLTASGAQAAGLTGGKWRIVSSLNPGSSLNELLGVVAVSATTVWAVGDSANSRHGPSQTLIEQGNGTNWQVVSSPNPGSSNNVLQGVAAVSATDVWAVGDYYNSTKHKYQTLTELYS